ncbi:DNA repair protein XRCC2 [Lampris incognitus]|uniref:DNA repair protein XRCC2 n=1 Tax=Lampris incognitus TaxID=2546036 RepID=UPI0024B53669|nr:DNA repair protein XRCC2 [Lampris incognitus]
MFRVCRWTGMGETAAQLLSRLDGRRRLSEMEPRLFSDDAGPGHGEVVELRGLEGTGKTELLYHLLCQCVLPVEVGGLCVEVVFVDTDFSLDMLRLVTILENRLEAGLSVSRAEGAVSPVEEALRCCLSRLFVVHCTSSSQLLLTLHYLETSVCFRPGVSLLLIDSISAFYWLDRCGGGESLAKQEEKLSKCSALLARLLRDYRISVVASSHVIRRSSRHSSSSGMDQPFLCRPWQQLVTHRLCCSTAQSGSNMAATAGSRRQVFTVHCCSSSSSSSRSSSFHVTDAGVEFI